MLGQGYFEFNVGEFISRAETISLPDLAIFSPGLASCFDLNHQRPDPWDVELSKDGAEYVPTCCVHPA